MSDRQLERYIEKADQLLVERRQKRWSRLRAMHFARREALYARALQAADYRTALAVLQDQAKLQDLYMDAQKLREIERHLKEMESLIKPLMDQHGAEDRLVTLLNGLPTEDKIRLAKLLKARKYDPGAIPAPSADEGIPADRPTFAGTISVPG